MTPNPQTAPVVIPPEVTAFAAESAVMPYLSAVIEMTQQVFPEAQLSIAIEDDPEIADDRHLVIITKVDQQSGDALDRVWDWHRGLFGRCPAPLVCVFRLGLESAR